MTRLRFAPFFVTALSLPIAFVDAQKVLPVHDLLYEEVARDRYIEQVRHTDWSLWPPRCFVGENLLGGMRMEDGSCFPDRHGRGHFTREQLAELLERLGFDADVRFLGKSLVVPQGATDACQALLDELRAALPPVVNAEIRLTQIIDGKPSVRLQRTVRMDPGRLHVVSSSSRRDAVIEYDVEIAQGAAAANPRVMEVRNGAMIAIRPQLAPSGEWGVFEIIARCADDPGLPPIASGHAGTGDIDRAAVQIGEVGRIVHIRPGATSVQRWSGPGGEFELQLQCQWQLPKPVRPGGRDFAIFSMRGELPGFRSAVTTPNEDNGWREDHNVWGDMSELAASDATWIAEPDSDTDSQRFMASGTASVAAGAAIAGWFESLTAGPVLDVRCFDVAANAGTSTDDQAVPADGKALGRAQFSQVNGTWSAMTVRRTQSYLHDWDIEVAQSSRIPDPNIRRLSTGFVLNMRRLGTQLELEGEISRLVDLRETTRQLNQPVFSPGASTSNNSGTNDSPAVGLLADTVRIERPEVRTAPMQASLELVPGGTVTWRTAAPELLGPGRDLLVVIMTQQ